MVHEADPHFTRFDISSSAEDLKQRILLAGLTPIDISDCD